MARIRGVVVDPFDEQVDEEADEVIISPALIDEHRERARQEVHERLADVNLECDFSSQVSLGQDIRIDRSEAAAKENRCQAFLATKQAELGRKLTISEHNRFVGEFETQESLNLSGKRRRIGAFSSLLSHKKTT